ncbi:Hypothetical predicted protein, partial [Olea europaea subsp. europaea]
PEWVFLPHSNGAEPLPTRHTTARAQLTVSLSNDSDDEDDEDDEDEDDETRWDGPFTTRTAHKWRAQRRILSPLGFPLEGFSYT